VQSLVLCRGSVASVERDVARQPSERSRDQVGEVLHITYLRSARYLSSDYYFPCLVCVLFLYLFHHLF